MLPDFSAAFVLDFDCLERIMESAMAKKKSAAPIAGEPKAGTKALKPAAAQKSSKEISSSSSLKVALNDKAPSAGNALGNHQIGETAGAVWNYLTDKEKASLATMKKDLSVSSDHLLAAVGWLAREDKLVFAVTGRSVTISLKS